MSEASARTEQAIAPYDMKAGQYMLPTLVLRALDVPALDAFLSQQVARLPAFFDQAPVAIDLSALGERDQVDELPMIVGMLRGHGMIPVGVRGASPEQKLQAQALELAIMPAGRKGPAAAPQSTQVIVVTSGKGGCRQDHHQRGLRHGPGDCAASRPWSSTSTSACAIST
jgi:septum site-determining protein MinC